MDLEARGSEFAGGWSHGQPDGHQLGGGRGFDSVPARGVRGRRYCRWLDQPKTRAPAGLPEGDAWSSTSSSDRGAYARTLIRVGNGIVGIQVQDPTGTAAAAALADRLAGLEASRLQSG